MRLDHLLSKRESKGCFTSWLSRTECTDETDTRDIPKYLVEMCIRDSYKNDKMLGALDKIIKYGKKHGYTFLPLTASTTEDVYKRQGQ